MTTLKLIKLRDKTYVPPLDVRCETCRHFSRRPADCFLDPEKPKRVHVAGRCDAWGSDKK